MAAGERPLLNDPNFSFFQPQFTPDGHHIVVLATRTDAPAYRQALIGRCDSDGSHLVWLTNDSVPAPNVSPSIRPIAFISIRTFMAASAS